MLKQLVLSILITAGLSLSAFADDNGWSGEASLTGSKTTGNTETTDVGLGVKLEKQADKWRHKFNASADYGEVSGAKNKSRWALGYQIDRDVSERLYIYGNADYFQDDFGAFEKGYFLGSGLGYKAVVTDAMSWNVEGGIGYRSQTTQTTPSVTTDEFAVRGFSDFDYQFNESVSLYNDTEIIWSDSDTYIWNETGITAQLMGNLAARASFRIDTHSDVPLGTEKTDTITRVGIVYTIG